MTSIHLSFVPKFFSSSPLALFPHLIFPSFFTHLNSSPFCAPLKILNLKFSAEFYGAHSPPHSKSPFFAQCQWLFLLKTAKSISKLLCSSFQPLSILPSFSGQKAADVRESAKLRAKEAGDSFS